MLGQRPPPFKPFTLASASAGMPASAASIAARGVGEASRCLDRRAGCPARGAARMGMERFLYRS